MSGQEGNPGGMPGGGFPGMPGMPGMSAFVLMCLFDSVYTRQKHSLAVIITISTIVDMTLFPTSRVCVCLGHFRGSCGGGYCYRAKFD